MATTTLQQLQPIDVDRVRLQIEEAMEAGDSDLCSELILKLLGHEALHAARAAAGRCVQRIPDDQRIARIQRLTAPPTVVPSPDLQRIPRRADFEWIKQHAIEYPGEWLVLSRGTLCGHARTLDEARLRAKEAGLSERPLLYHVYQE